MKLYIILSILSLNFSSYTQTGYQKSIKLEYSNGIISAQIINDTLSVCNLSNNLKNGFYIDNFLLDTLAKKIKEFKIINDSIPYVGYPGESSKVISYDESDKTYNYAFSSGYILFIKYSYEKDKLEFIKKYKQRPGKLDNIRPFGIIPVSDGYVIYGDTQWENEQYKVYGFLLKIDKEGNEVAWKILKGSDDSYQLINGFSDDNGIITICGYHYTHNISNISEEFIMSVSKNNLDILDTKIISSNIQRIYLNNIFKYSKTYKGIGLNRDKNSNYSFPALFVFDSLFTINKINYFGIRDEDLVKIETEIPFQSTSDKEGNIYATTTSLIYPTPEKVDTESIEVITLTKFNPEGDIVWETIDSFDKKALAIKDRWIRPVISSVNVASSGSVFVTGYYSDTEEVFVLDTFTDFYYYVYYDSLLMKDTFEIRDSVKIDTITQLNRGVGFLFKYDKDGCRISGCRIVDTQEETIKEEKLVIYPNPTNDKIHLTSSVNWLNAKVSIVDVQGKTWMDFKHNHRDDIDVSNLPPGIYTFTLEKDGNVQREKFIKL